MAQLTIAVNVDEAAELQEMRANSPRKVLLQMTDDSIVYKFNTRVERISDLAYVPKGITDL